jgi:hypothetical protein
MARRGTYLMDDRGPREGIQVGVARDYIDALRYQSRFYRRHLVRSERDRRAGRLVFRVRDTLSLSDTGDPYHAPSLADEAATVLPVGTPVHEVAGYPPERRLAADVNGELRIYIADI